MPSYHLKRWKDSAGQIWKLNFLGNWFLTTGQHTLGANSGKLLSLQFREKWLPCFLHRNSSSCRFRTASVSGASTHAGFQSSNPFKLRLFTMIPAEIYSLWYTHIASRASRAVQTSVKKQNWLWFFKEISHKGQNQALIVIQVLDNHRISGSLSCYDMGKADMPVSLPLPVAHPSKDLAEDW